MKLMGIVSLIVLTGLLFSVFKLNDHRREPLETYVTTSSSSITVDPSQTLNTINPYLYGVQNGSEYYNSAISSGVVNKGGIDTLRIHVTTNAGSRFLYKYNGNPKTYRTVEAFDNIPIVNNREYKVEFKKINKTISLSVDGVQVLQYTDDEDVNTNDSCPYLLATHDWYSKYTYSNIQIQKYNSDGTKVGDSINSSSPTIIDESPKGDYLSGPARKIAIPGLPLCAELGLNYSVAASIKSYSYSSTAGLGYIGLSLLGGTYNFLWDNGVECQYMFYCGGVGGWNNYNLEKELKMADEMGAAIMLDISTRMSPQTLLNFLHDLKNKKYNNTDYIAKTVTNGLFIEVGDEEYGRPEYKNNKAGYAKQINDYAKLIKPIYPSVKIGYTGLYDSSYVSQGCKWDRDLLPQIIDNIDFIAISHYPHPDKSTLNLDQGSTICDCPDSTNRSSNCDEVWTSSSLGRIERMRDYMRHSLEKAGYAVNSPQVQKVANIMIYISGYNLEGTSTFYSDGVLPSRDPIKWAKFLGLLGEKNVASSISCCGLTASNPSTNIYNMSIEDPSMKVLYLYNSHFGNQVIKKEVSGDVIAYASKNQRDNALYTLIVGQIGQTVDINIVGDVGSSVKVWTLNGSNSTPLKTLNYQKPFQYTMDDTIVSLEFALNQTNNTPIPTPRPSPTMIPTPIPTQRVTPRPTSTVVPTPTPKPTSIVTPIITPRPTVVQTPRPTSTPRPTNIPTVRPTVTPTVIKSNGDLNNDGKVNQLDLVEMLRNWGKYKIATLIIILREWNELTQ